MRSQSLVLLLISFFFVKFAQSQSDELLIQGQTGNLYLEHTVVAKENWYSVGRLYNISPKELAPYNKLTMTQPLTIGEKLEIPLTVTNFSQNGQKAPAETLVPLYHVIQEKEWMYRISVNHNKVPIASLEKWNNINKDQVKAGMHLIVGYLKVKTALSALAAGGGAPAVAANPAAGNPAGGSSPVVASKGAASTAGTSPVSTSTTDKTPATTSKTSTAGSGATSSAGTPPATNTKTANPPIITATVSSTPPAVKEESSAAKEESKPVIRPNSPVTPPATSSTPAIHFNGGYFKTDFVDGGKSINGSAGIFKSTSGWQDGKYYALMNNVAVGTIIRINTSSGKSVYAKILGQLPDMKESAGLTVRISNAAASELGEGEGRFTVEVKY